jgi:hypothetical protein
MSRIKQIAISLKAFASNLLTNSRIPCELASDCPARSLALLVPARRLVCVTTPPQPPVFHLLPGSGLSRPRLFAACYQAERASDFIECPAIGVGDCPATEFRVALRRRIFFISTVSPRMPKIVDRGREIVRSLPLRWVVSVFSLLRGAIRDTITEVPVSSAFLRFPTLDRIAGHAIRFRLRYMRYDPCIQPLRVSYLLVVDQRRDARTAWSGLSRSHQS